MDAHEHFPVVLFGLFGIFGTDVVGDVFPVAGAETVDACRGRGGGVERRWSGGEAE